MIRSLTLAAALTAALALSAMAADTTIKVDAGAAPVSTAAGASSAPATNAVTSAAPIDSLLLTEQEGKTWVNKPVYSSDGSKLGQVVDFQRAADNKVISMHADVGGFLGMWQTRINLTTPQFKLQGDRVVLNLTAAEVKVLPSV